MQTTKQMKNIQISNKDKNMMNTNNKQSETMSDPLSDVSSFNGSTDIDLAGIPPFILDLQRFQPTLNIMTCGDVSHGKSTLLAALSGEKTGKHSREKKGNMTIRLGYTSCKIYKCLQCPRPNCYFSTHSDAKTPTKCPQIHCDSTKLLLIRHLSFVDVPGHNELMQTMVSATSIADCAICVIDSSKKVPGKQLAQHLDAMNLLALMRQNKVIIAQNKIDLISPQKACKNYEEIRSYFARFNMSNAPIIPISAQSKLNIDALCSFIIGHLPKFSPNLLHAHKQSANSLFLSVIRSFDVNRAKDLLSFDDIDSICGGVIGGAVMSGQISINQQIEIRPGYLVKSKEKNSALKGFKFNSKWKVQPIRTSVKSLKYGKNSAKNGFCGGNVGVETFIDPSLTKSDRMCGHIVIDANDRKPPPIFNKFLMSYSLISKGAKFSKYELIKLNVGSAKLRGEVIGNVKEFDGALLIVLEHPICARVGDKIGICRKNKKSEWLFVGGGIIRKTKNIFIESDVDKMSVCVSSSSSPLDIGHKSKEIVHLRYQQRTTRKGITTVIGLPKRIKIKKLMIRMKKAFNCGATLVEEENGQIIQIQGDLRRDVAKMIEKLQIVKKTQIIIHGF